MGEQMSESMKQYFAEIRRYPLLTREEELDLARQAREGNTASFNRLIECNLRFVVKVAGWYRNFGVPMEDLINEGNLGLIEAAQRFDPEREIRFISWAVWWIRRTIRNALTEQSHTVRLPESQIRKMRKTRKVEQALIAELGREPALDEIAERMELPADLTPVDLHGVRMASLDEPAGDARRDPLADVLEDHGATPEEELLHREATEQVARLYEQLEGKERTVICGRFGMDGEKVQTLGQLGRRIGHSREGVRLIERRAVRRLEKRLLASTYEMPHAGRAAADLRAAV